MSLFKIAWRSIQQRSLASSLTAFSMALGVMLVCAVLIVSHVLDNYFLSGAGLGYNLVVGKKGSSMQLVFNTVYYLDRPIENIPWSFYKEFLPADQRSDKQEGMYSRWVEHAVPVNMGDYLEGFRVIGTTPDMFGKLEQQPGKKFEFAAGENFKKDDYFGAVIGYGVYEELGKEVNDQFTPTHSAPDGHVHDDKFTIRGVLKRTGTPIDRGVFVNIEGFYLLDGHAMEAPAEEANATDEHAQKKGHDHAHDHDHEHHHHHEPLAENLREVTAVLVLTKSPPGDLPSMPELGAQSIMGPINKGNIAQAVEPIRVIHSFMGTFLNPLRIVLLVLTTLVVVISAVSILVSIYNSMSERRHEIAVMRALGASRGTVMLIMLLESILLAVAGGIAGWLLGHGLILALGPWITSRAGVVLSPFQFAPAELWLIPGIIGLASLVGYLPAWSAYRTDVARSLSASP
ncbi:MAG: ABC transporter permease [Planctomycetota bacterium]|nr:ABC transporter permease [Planctomycetota bacterium]